LGEPGHPDNKSRAFKLQNQKLLLCPLFVVPLFGQTVISPDHPELLQSQILSAYKAGQKVVVVPPGVYRIPYPSMGAGAPHLSFSSMADFEIDATGATFIFADTRGHGIWFSNCDNVALKGATLYYDSDKPPFTQGVVQAVSTDGLSVDVRIDQAYPTNLDDPRYFPAGLLGHLFDPVTRWWKPGPGDLNGVKTLRLGSDTFRISLSGASNAQVGDLVGIRGSGGFLLLIDTCSRMDLMSLTILNSPGGGCIHEQGGGSNGANHFSGITIKRGLRPAGGVGDPLFSATSDAIHSEDARIGPVVENCDFQAMPDDGINIHGRYHWVVQSSDNSLIVSAQPGNSFQPGDPLRLFDAQDAPAGEANVIQVTPLPGFHNDRKSARQGLASDYMSGPYFQIDLDRALQADFDYVASNPSASGAGYVIRNNTIHNNRARGLLLKGDNGLVENNTLDGNTFSGIEVAPELTFSESCFSRNVTIRNNIIRNVGAYGPQPALWLGIWDPSQPGGPPPAGHRNIVIEGNTFSDFGGDAIRIASATGVTVQNNVFQRLTSTRLVTVQDSQGVTFSGNSASDLDPANNLFLFAIRNAQFDGVPTVGGIGVVNGASYTAPVAPGMIAAIFGSYLTDGRSCLPPCGPAVDGNGLVETTMTGTQVTVNGILAPLLYTSANQVGVQIPMELTGSTVSLQIIANGLKSSSYAAPLAAAAPGIFVAGKSVSGKDQGEVAHADGTPVTPDNPAARNEEVVIYATGLGQVIPNAPTGSLPASATQTAAATTVNIDGLLVVPDSAGLAGCCVGLNLVNVRVPANSHTGDEISLQLSAGGRQSNVVTLAVQ
jgi:uncharacterized protein (TIGR03437 family)